MLPAAFGAISIASQLTAAVSVDRGLEGARAALSTTDHLILLTSVAVTVVTVTWWLMRSRRDPLDQAPPRANTLREDAIVLAALVYLLAAAIGSSVAHYVGDASEGSILPHLVGSGAQLVGGVACLLIARGRFAGGAYGFCFGGARSKLWPVLVTALALVVVAMGLCPEVLRLSVWVGERLVPTYRFEPHPTIEALHLHPESVGTVVGLWIGAAVIAPVAEEFFFRGLLQTFLANVLGSRWRAIAVASIAFASVHLAQPHAIPALALFAVLLGVAYERTGSLLTPILMHAAFNLRTLVWDLLSGPAM